MKSESSVEIASGSRVPKFFLGLFFAELALGVVSDLLVLAVIHSHPELLVLSVLPLALFFVPWFTVGWYLKDMTTFSRWIWVGIVAFEALRATTEVLRGSDVYSAFALSMFVVLGMGLGLAARAARDRYANR